MNNNNHYIVLICACACTYAYVASENQAFDTENWETIYTFKSVDFHLGPEM